MKTAKNFMSSKDRHYFPVGFSIWAFKCFINTLKIVFFVFVVMFLSPHIPPASGLREPGPGPYDIYQAD